MISPGGRLSTIEAGRGNLPAHPGRILFLLILLAFVVRLAAALTRDMIQLDETAYVSMAQNLAAGKGPLDITGLTSTYFSPLLPIFIAGVAAVLGDYILSGYAVVAVFGVLMLVPVYLLGREFAGQRAALMAAALIAVMPIFVTYSSLVYSESIYTFFLLMALFFGWHMLRAGRLTCGVSAGVSLGLAYLANPAAVFYLIVLLVLAAAVAIRRGGWRRMARSAGIFLAAFLVFAAPYLMFLHAELGRWTYTGKYADVNLYGSTQNLRLGTLEWEQDLLGLTGDSRGVRVNTLPNNVDLLSFVVKNPKPAGKIFVEQSFILYSDLLPKVLPLWLLPLLGVGLFARGWNRKRALAVGYLLLMAAPVLLVLAMYAHDRFFIPYAAMVVVWLGVGWQRLEDWGRETVESSCSAAWRARCSRLMPWLVGAAVLLPPLVFAGGTVLRGSEAIEYKEAGQWLRDNGGGGARIMNRESPSAFYAGGAPVFLPYADYERTTAYARYQGIDYMVVGRQVILDWRPELKALLGEDSRHPEWKLVHVVRPGTERETLVFRLDHEPG